MIRVFTGPRTPDLSSSTSTRVDGDDDDDDDDQSNQVFTTTERDGNDDNDDDGSSSASAPPRDGEERQKAAESEAMVEHTAPGGDAIEQHRGGDMRADSPVEVFSQPDPISQCAGNLSAHQGGDLSIQSRPVEVSTQRQHEQESAAAGGGEEQIQEQGRRAPQTPQQSGQPGEQGGQSPTPQATHFTALLRKAAAGTDSRHNRSKYEYRRPASPHLPRPRRAHRSKASSRLAGGFDDMPGIVSEGPRGPAGISQPGTQGASQSQAESFSPDHSGTRAQGRGKPAVSARSPNVDPAPGSKFSFPSPTASQLGTEAAKVIRGIRGSLQDTSRTPGHQDTRTPGHQDTCRTPPSPSASQLGTEAEKVIRGIQGNLQDISTPELAASKAATSPKSWLSGKLGNLVLSRGSQVSKKTPSGKAAPAAQQQSSTPQVSQPAAGQYNAGPVREGAGGEQPAPQAGGVGSQRRSSRVAERQGANTPGSILRKRLFTKK